jgi:outer membrane protein OmpA-like peptidoglycan-associated protein
MKSSTEILMSLKAFAVGVAAVVIAVPAAAQQRGTIEFGAFGSAASFDNNLSLKTGYGGGGRVGAFLTPTISLEFEDAEMRAKRPNGLRDVNVGLLSGRIVAAPVRTGALSLLVGGGAGVSTETNFLHSYGVDVLAGAKIALRPNVALRIDGVWDWLANENWKSYKSVRLGLSVYRRPSRETIVRTETVTTPAPAPMMMTHSDSVSADETRRLRDREAALRALRDSLRNNPPARMAPTTTRQLKETMEASIHFAFNKSVLTDSAKAVLDSKIGIFRANPDMTIVMVGYTDIKGTDKYNMALGERRAEAAKAYIVARGIDSGRVLMESKGKRAQIPNSSGAAGEAANRRVIFRLLMTPDVISKP